jgi:hypothetical protein
MDADTRPRLGQLLGPSELRDAVHVALCPMMAGERLEPGEHVRVEDGDAHSAAAGEGVGVVDPFLRRPVEPGERFWLLLYPGTITSLRHEWSHPAIPDEDADIAASEAWLREVAENSRTDYDELLAGALSGHIQFGSETDGSIWAQGHFAELWHHLGIVLRRRFEPVQYAFSCSC